MSLEIIKAKFSAFAVHGAPLTAGADTPAALPVSLVVETRHAVKGYDLDVTVPPERVTDAARLLDEAAFMLEAITGLDWIAEQQFEVVYDYTSLTTGARVTVRARLPRATPELPSIAGIYPGANWHERETHDFFGIVFTGHPGLTTLLLPEDAVFHPLLKDFSA
jgi:NADH-quinone oxidoreductase subunit C